MSATAYSAVSPSGEMMNVLNDFSVFFSDSSNSSEMPLAASRYNTASLKREVAGLEPEPPGDAPATAAAPPLPSPDRPARSSATALDARPLPPPPLPPPPPTSALTKPLPAAVGTAVDAPPPPPAAALAPTSLAPEGYKVLAMAAALAPTDSDKSKTHS
jgi:hypothetical protein